ncbi:MAG: hypothetical protein KKD21_15800, partial [Proteobacteria bacterium]|nr:hypothetical protein [Pseudomonadota bacterium]
MGANNSGIVLVELRYREAGGLDWIPTGESDVFAPSSSSVSGTFNFNVASLPDGTYEFATIATDDAGNQEDPPATADATTILDHSAPTVTSVTTTPDPAGEGNVTITITFADDGCGIENDTAPTVTYTIGATTVTVVQTSYTGNTWIGQAPVVGDPTDCQATINISGAADCCGNVMSANSDYGFSIDTVAPVISTVQIRPQGGAVGDCSAVGEVTFIVTLAEVCGLDYSALAPVVVQFTPAGSTTPVPVTQYSYSNNVWTGKAMVDATMGNGNATVDITGATDLAGNVAQANNSYSFCIDTTAPQSWTEDLPSCSTGNQILVDYESNDPDAPGAGSPSGVEEVQLWYRLAGDVNWIYSGLSAAAPPTGGTFTFNVTSLPDRTYEFATQTTDNVGNQEALPAVADATTILDRSRPTVASVAIDAEQAGEGYVTIAITFNDVGCGIEYDSVPTVTYQVGLNPAVTVTQISYANNTWTGQAFISGSDPEGPATITVEGAADCCGNVMIDNDDYGFCIDRTAPVVNTVQINPQNRGVGECSNIGEVTFTITFTENGCAGLDPDVPLEVLFNPAGTDEEIPVDGSYSSGNTWGGTAIVTEDMANGDATVIIRGATDRAGNAMAPYNQASFCIDTTPPQSWVEALSTHSNQSSITVKYQDNDPGVGNSGVNTVQLWYRLNGGTWIK